MTGVFAHDTSETLLMYGKEGINVGASGAIGYFPTVDMTLCILANLENCTINLMWQL